MFFFALLAKKWIFGASENPSKSILIDFKIFKKINLNRLKRGSDGFK